MSDPAASSSRASRPGKTNGPLLTLLILVIVEALSRTASYLPEASPLYFIAIVYSAATAGLRSGLISAALVFLHALYACSTPYVPHQLFHMTDDNLRRFLAIALTAPLVAVLVGRLKERMEHRVRNPAKHEQE